MSQVISIDLETYLISEEHPAPKPVCISYYDGTTKGLLTKWDDIQTFLDRILSSNFTIVAHNASFEGLVIDEWYPELRKKLINKYEKNEFICTKIYEQLIDNVRKKPIYSFGLDKLVEYYFKEDISEDKKNPDSWRLRYSELDGVPKEEWPQEAIDYAINDSVWAYKIYLQQKKAPIDTKLSIEADFWLNRMGLQGICVDKTRIATLEQELIAKLTPRYKTLEEKGLTEFNEKTKKYKKNNKKFVEHVKTLDIIPEYTAKGNLSVSRESLDRYFEQCEDPLISDYLDIMKYEKVLTAFVARLKTANDRVRTQYNAVVSSGRTSSRTSAAFPSVNMQQMPREVPGVTWDIRNCFVPREGYKICSIDYSGLELSSTAHQLYDITGNSEMRDVINSGDVPTDMHSKLACRIMSIKENKTVTYEEFVANKKESPYKYYRQLSKPINLGFPGGIGYETMRSLLIKEGINPKLVVLDKSENEDSLTWKRSILRKEGHPVRVRRVGFSEYQLVYDELVQLKQELFNLYPDLEYFLTKYHEQFLNGETKRMKNEFGEWETEPLYDFEVGGYAFVRAHCMYTQVCNGLLMQSPAAIGAKRAVCDILKRYVDSDEVRALAFIHDELVFEIKDNENMQQHVQDLSEMMIDSMQTVLNSVRIAVEAETFPYWKKSGGEYCVAYFKDPGGKGGLREVL